jgi:hypothetical protein
VRNFRFRSPDISQITKLLTWPVECMAVDARVRTRRKRYVFDPQERLCIVLARLSTVGRWREMEQVLFRSAGACCEIIYFVVSIFFAKFSPLEIHPLNHSVNCFYHNLCSADAFSCIFTLHVHDFIGKHLSSCITSAASYHIRGSSREQEWSAEELHGLFFDGTKIAIARPPGVMQRATYSGHKRSIA